MFHIYVIKDTPSRELINKGPHKIPPRISSTASVCTYTRKIPLKVRRGL